MSVKLQQSLSGAQTESSCLLACKLLQDLFQHLPDLEPRGSGVTGEKMAHLTANTVPSAGCELFLTGSS